MTRNILGTGKKEPTMAKEYILSLMVKKKRVGLLKVNLLGSKDLLSRKIKK